MNEIISKFNNSSKNKELTNSLTKVPFFSISSDFTLEELSNILKKNPYLINTQDENNETFLSYAIKRNNSEIINLILNSPLLNLTYQNEITGNTYLHLAVIHQNIKLVKKLLEKEIFTDTQNNEGNTALHLAYYFNNINIIKLLIENNIDFAIKNKKGLIAEEIDPIENVNDNTGYEANSNEIDLNLNNLNFSNSGETKYKSSLKTKNEKNNKKLKEDIDMNINNFDMINNIDIIDNLETLQNDLFKDQEKELGKDFIELSGELNLSTINHNEIDDNNSKEEKIINCTNKSLYEFLSQINMQKYYDNFNNNGFEYVNLIIEDFKLGNHLTDVQLKLIGISNPGDRAKILIRFEEKSNLFDFNIPKSVYYLLNTFDKIENDINIIKLNNWLKKIKLEEYLIKFINNGYYSIELLLMQSLSKNPLSDDILKNEFNIEKLGHRTRILNKLNEESKNYFNHLRNSKITFHVEENPKICSECFIF